MHMLVCMHRHVRFCAIGILIDVMSNWTGIPNQSDFFSCYNLKKVRATSQEYIFFSFFFQTVEECMFEGYMLKRKKKIFFLIFHMIGSYSATLG